MDSDSVSGSVSVSAENTSTSRVSSREGSRRELSASRGSVKSTRSAERNSRDVQFEAGAKAPNRIIANWRHACDRTRDRTRDLLKRWRTLPEYEASDDGKQSPASSSSIKPEQDSGWSVHVWTTWVDRFSVDNMDGWEGEASLCQLTPIQSNKFAHFFTTLLDHDQDELISEQDIGALIERLRHFADWSTNSPEYNILHEVERGFMDTFLQDLHDEKLGFQVNNESYLSLDGWLVKWAQLVSGSRNLNDFPIWLQYFVKVLFQVVNRSGSGIITRDELAAFYSSVLGLDAIKVDEILDLAYRAMTSNGDHLLGFKAFRLCFANYLLGRYPNGPGQYMLGAAPLPLASALFPVDYSALNAQPEDLEQYAPDNKTTRRSVIV